MNRTDQAPEPTMEEILASIRSIISDDGKKASAKRDDQASRGPSRPEAAPPAPLPEEDVLDLTEAHVFPDDQPPAAAPASFITPPAMTHAPAFHEPEEAIQRDEETRAEEAEEKQAADAPPQPEEDQSLPEPSPDPAPQSSIFSRAIWSRREAPPASASGTRFEASPRQPQRGWAGDVQMPIPERGPVPFMPSQMQGQSEEAAGDHEPAGEPIESESDERPALSSTGEAAAAALAGSIARSAAEALDSDELASAGGVDFSKIAGEQKAEVSEIFANVIARESAPRDNRLPNLFDEVFRQDFRRDHEAKAEARLESEPSSVQERSGKTAAADPLDTFWGAPAAAFHGAASPQPAPQVRNEAPPRITAALPEETSAPKASPYEAEAAQPAASGQTLEDTVRDMLRPLLAQWLDEHMPRILANAIREEIATRGLSPKAEK